MSGRGFELRLTGLDIASRRPFPELRGGTAPPSWGPEHRDSPAVPRCTACPPGVDRALLVLL